MDKKEILRYLNKIKIPLLIGVFLTILFYSLAIFFNGIELLLIPVFLVVFIAGLLGVFTIPLGFYKIYKKIEIKGYLIWLIGLALGFYIGLLIQKPIDSWDKRQRNLSGEYVVKKIQDHYLQTGNYPDSLTMLYISTDSLAGAYSVDRFGYTKHDSTFTLYLPIPIMDRWEWNILKSEFEYVDF